ncbi:MULTISPECIES: hypothetical protein [Gracilibacillus]|uniref:hypothetical protein n=1 Tax=Gracilibacillus TaxID=74385 RepID=UPI000A60546D|nr:MULTISPECIES: hypothetical protein [Gracilibacillus]
MWKPLLGVLPEYLILVCTILALLIPYVIYKINQQLHKYGDPPWKAKSDEKKSGDEK